MKKGAKGNSIFLEPTLSCIKTGNGLKMIQINEKDSEKGFYTLLTNGPAHVKKDNKYIVPSYCLQLLKKANVNFKVIKSD